MKVTLNYGRNGLVVDLPDHSRIVAPRHQRGLPNEASAIREALRHPIGSPPLALLVRPGDKVVISHTDVTRATPNGRILPILLDELESAGIVPGDITLLNAIGTHRKQTVAELRQMLGDQVVDRYRCIQHDGDDDAGLVPLGRTSFGNPVRVNRLFVESDVRILTGFVEPHFFAGFSGGPKGVMPALAGNESVYSNHGYSMLAHPRATWGTTEGNPVWEEMREVALLAKPTFLLNVTLNRQHQITGVFAGDLVEAHRLGCDFCRESAMVRVEAPFDIVITTNSGYPLDQNLYQSTKGISGGNQIVRKGGTILIATACAEGLPDHGHYAELLRRGGSPQGVLDLISQPGFGEQDQWAVQIQAMVQLRANVQVYSDGLTDDQIRQALLWPCRDIEGTVAALQSGYGQDARICVLPEGPQTIAYIDPSFRESDPG
jgi:nickel-dependent lactate racemase